MTLISRTCNLCNTKMTGGIEGFKAHGEEHHPNHYLAGSEKSGRWEFAEKNYWCPLDEQWYASRKYLARTIKANGWTNERYFLTYGEQYMPREWDENTNDSKYGDAYSRNTCLQCTGPVTFNEGKWMYPAFCCSSCSTKWHAENTDRIERAMATLSERKATDPTLHLRPNQIAYWTMKGFSEDEAREKVAERQRTNTLEKFIERYGEEGGYQRFADRQEAWFKAITSNQMFKGYSNVSHELFEALSKHVSNIKYGQSEMSVRVADTVVKVDCIDIEKRKIIEFFGDHWHANPNHFAPDDVVRMVNKTASEIWRKDETRNQKLKAAGFDVLVIWESDYRDNPDLILGKCIGFMT